MKALQELVDYLSSRGMLSSQEKVSLAARGFLDLPDKDTTEEEDALDPYAPIEDRLTRRRAHKRGGRPSHKGMRADEIDAALSASIQSWSAPLEGLRAVGQYLAPGDTFVDWRQASLQVARKSPYIIALYLPAMIASGALRFASLWESLALRAPFDVIEGQPGGFDVVSYRRLLSSSSDDALKRYGWILRYDSVQSAYNVVKAQNHLWSALKILFAEEPARLSGWLQRDPHPLAFWVMTLLFSAGQEVPPSHASRTRIVSAPDNDDPLWRRAWSVAAWLNPALPGRLTSEAGALIELSCPAHWKMK